jgi:hypothetical protein
MINSNTIRVLVACEESQVITRAFRKLGFEAYSCDLQWSSGGHPEWHIRDDVLNIINDNWHLMIAHPPCTYLAKSSAGWLYNSDGSRNVWRWDKLKEGAEFFKKLLNANIPYIAVENPIPLKYAVEIIGRKYDQIIQPYQFGHPEQKATCLWLKNLPLLQETNDVRGKMKNMTKRQIQRLHYLPPGKDRAKIRSKTYSGIAEAMAIQWGKYVLQNIMIYDYSEIIENSK